MPFDPKSLCIREDAPGTKRFCYDEHFEFAPVQRLDAAQNMFLERELRHMIPRVFRREFAKINARSVFPVYFANDPGATEIAYEYVEEYGEAEIVADFSDDAPLAEAKTSEFSTKVRSIHAAAQWSIQEIRAAARANRPLRQSKVDTARDAMLRKENKIGFHGDEDFGLKGFFNFDEVPRTSAAQTIANGTPMQNLQELHDIANGVADATEDVESANTILIPPAQYDRVSTQHLGTDGDGPTVLQDFLETNPHVSQAMRTRELKGAGAGGSDTIVVFDRNIEKLRLNVALDVEQFAPERRGKVVRVEYHMREGGMTMHFPKSAAILENV